jgi:hypothetical protein
MVTQVPLEINVGNKVNARVFSLGVLFIEVISRGTNFIARISTGNLFFQQLIHEKYDYPRYP